MFSDGTYIRLHEDLQCICDTADYIYFPSLLRHILSPTLCMNSTFHILFLPLPPAAAYDECSPVTVEEETHELVSVGDDATHETANV